jgi:hypothetical protein
MLTANRTFAVWFCDLAVILSIYRIILLLILGRLICKAKPVDASKDASKRSSFQKK